MDYDVGKLEATDSYKLYLERDDFIFIKVQDTIDPNANITEFITTVFSLLSNHYVLVLTLPEQCLLH